MNSGYVLLVDDEEQILRALRRTLELSDYEVRTTTNPSEALRLLKEAPPAILVCDQRMPQMTGLELLLKARQISPRSVRILISGYSDIDVVISAINGGQIFQYIDKPWNDEELRDKIHAAWNYWHETQQKEQIVTQSLRDKELWRSLLERSDLQQRQNRANTANALKKIIRVKDEELLLHSLRVSQYALQVAERLEVPASHQEDLKLAGWFHDIGKIAIRDQILYKAGKLDETEYSSMKNHPLFGAEILREIDGWNSVAEIVLQHHEKFDGTGYPRNLKGEEILLEARILAVADAFDALVSKRIYRAGLPVQEAMAVLMQDAGSHFDRRVVTGLTELQPSEDFASAQ